MRKITAGLFIALNGMMEAPETWNPPYYDDELNQAGASQTVPLTLLESRPHRNGVVALRYAPAGQGAK